jgi:superfamily II DNA or RNA helicase
VSAGGGKLLRVNLLATFLSLKILTITSHFQTQMLAERVNKTPEKKRKLPWNHPARFYGTKKATFTISEISNQIKQKLQLSFDLEDWQSEIIKRIIQRYDCIFIAGTGYGKSIIFEGVAALQPNKIAIVISPLKALERDQVKSKLYNNASNTLINYENR